MFFFLFYILKIEKWKDWFGAFCSLDNERIHSTRTGWNSWWVRIGNTFSFFSLSKRLTSVPVLTGFSLSLFYLQWVFKFCFKPLIASPACSMPQLIAKPLSFPILPSETSPGVLRNRYLQKWSLSHPPSPHRQATVIHNQETMRKHSGK